MDVLLCNPNPSALIISLPPPPRISLDILECPVDMFLLPEIFRSCNAVVTTLGACIGQKYVPLDLRHKKTRAIRRRLTKHQVLRTSDFCSVP